MNDASQRPSPADLTHLHIEPRSTAEGTVDSPETAARSELVRAFNESRFLGFVLAALLILLVGERGNIVNVPAAVVLGCIGVALLRREINARRRRFSDWDGLPPAGTVVQANDSGLTLAERRIAWSDVELADIRTRSEWPWWGSVFAIRDRLERIYLRTPQGRVMLDARMLRNGQAILDTVYSRLRNDPKGTHSSSSI